MNQELEKIVGIVQAKDLTFEYIRRDEEGNVEGITTAVDNVNIDIKAGDFVAVLGHNGSGKSTFAKHLNALVMPTEGTVYVWMEWIQRMQKIHLRSDRLLAWYFRIRTTR